MRLCTTPNDTRDQDVIPSPKQPKDWYVCQEDSEAFYDNGLKPSDVSVRPVKPGDEM